MRDVLRAPGALGLFLASCVARLPMGALGLLLVLHTQQITGSYAKGGLASGAYAIALGISNPALARVVDRRGQTLVLRLGAPLAAAAIVVLATAPRRRPARRDPRRRGRRRRRPAAGRRVHARAVAGAARQPGPPPRRLLDGGRAARGRLHLRPGRDRRGHRLVVDQRRDAGLRGLPARRRPGLRRPPDLARVAPARRGRARPHRRAARPRRARLVAVFVLCGLSVGAVEVAVPAALDTTGHRELTGVLLGLWGVGSMFAGLAIGRLGAAADPPRRLAIALAAWGLATPRSASPASRPCSA